MGKQNEFCDLSGHGLNHENLFEMMYATAKVIDQIRHEPTGQTQLSLRRWSRPSAQQFAGLSLQCGCRFVLGQRHTDGSDAQHDGVTIADLLLDISVPAVEIGHEDLCRQVVGAKALPTRVDPVRYHDKVQVRGRSPLRSEDSFAHDGDEGRGETLPHQ